MNQRALLQIVLLQALAEHSEGLRTTAAYDLIHQTHTFPEDWYRQMPRDHETLRELGYADWRTIPQQRLVELVSTEPQWQNELRWARKELNDKGWLDATARHGTWRLSPTGIDAAKNIKLETLKPEERAVVTRTPPRQHQTIKPAIQPRQAAEGLRESLQQKLKTLTQAMPLEDLDLLVDIARSIRARSLTDDSAH